MLKQGFGYVVDADLKSYFDTIPHDRLMTRLRERVADGRVLGLIETFLKAGILEGMKEWEPEAGAPQGAVLSPLLSNIYLSPLDHQMAAGGFRMVRYADDFVVLCRSQAEAEHALTIIHLAQRVFATPSGAKAEAAGGEFLLEDRLDDVADRGLHHSVADGGNPQGPLLVAPRFGDVHPPDRLRFVGTAAQRLGQFRHVRFPFAPPALPGFDATMDALTPARRLFVPLSAAVNTVLSAQVSLLHGSCLPTLPSPNTPRRPTRLVLQRRLTGGQAVYPRKTSSLGTGASFGLRL